MDTTQSYYSSFLRHFKRPLTLKKFVRVQACGFFHFKKTGFSGSVSAKSCLINFRLVISRKKSECSLQNFFSYRIISYVSENILLSKGRSCYFQMFFTNHRIQTFTRILNKCPKVGSWIWCVAIKRFSIERPASSTCQTKRRYLSDGKHVSLQQLTQRAMFTSNLWQGSLYLERKNMANTNLITFFRLQKYVTLSKLWVGDHY